MDDRHAGQAQARADEAYGVGNNALSAGNGAMTSAQQANVKADANTIDMNMLKRRFEYLEYKLLPHHSKHHRVHHYTPTNTEQAKNS